MDERTSGEHYFTASPASAEQRRTVSVRLAGVDAQVETAGGVFSGGHVDLGTAVLMRTVPDPPASGELLDLGCGWGPIALTLGLLSPRARVWAVDVNDRALALVRANAEAVGRQHRVAPIVAARPDEVPADLTFAAIWSNPPIRIGKRALHELLAAWLPRLAPGAAAHLVVGKNLGADSLAAWLADQRDEAGAPWGAVERVASAKGFRVLRLVRGDAAA